MGPAQKLSIVHVSVTAECANHTSVHLQISFLTMAGPQVALQRLRPQSPTTRLPRVPPHTRNEFVIADKTMRLSLNRAGCMHATVWTGTHACEIALERVCTTVCILNGPSCRHPWRPWTRLRTWSSATTSRPIERASERTRQDNITTMRHIESIVITLSFCDFWLRFTPDTLATLALAPAAAGLAGAGCKPDNQTPRTTTRHSPREALNSPPWRAWRGWPPAKHQQ